MSTGYDKPLYILPFDYRGSIQAKMFGWPDELTEEHFSKITETKQVIYHAFTSAIAAGVPKDRAGIQVDEQFGASILRDAAEHGYVTVCPAEKRGQDEFEFEYGEEFAEHIEAFHPTFCKAQVRYNPEGDKALNERQVVRLARLSEYLHRKGTTLLMVELIVPPEKTQLERLKGKQRAYVSELLPQLVAQSIEELQDAHVEPDVWGIEGLDQRNDLLKVIEAARRGRREKVSCILLDRDGDDLKVRNWLRAAAEVRGFIGFAVGQTCFWEPLIAWRYGTVTWDAAVTVIARRYQRFVDVFQNKAMVA